MELRHLRYFVVVAEEQSITRAAARLNIAPPPLSRQIRDLEDELQVRLFTHGANQIQLTAAGRLYLGEAVDILSRVEAATRKVRALPNESGGEIRLGYAPSPTVDLLPRVLKAFRKVAPNTRVALLDLPTDDMLAHVAARTLDVALLTRPPLKRNGGLQFETLVALPVGLLVSIDHPFARRRSVTLDEVLQEPLVVFVRKGYSDYHEWLKQVLSAARRKPRIAAYADGSATLMAAVQSGQGVGFGPAIFTKVATGRVKYVSISPATPPVDIGFVIRTGPRSPLVESFVTVLRMTAAERTD